jgi:nitrous oxidase accessory protein
MKITFTISFLFLFISSCFAKTIIVGGNQPVKTLKQAIVMAKDKDSILILPGIYKEGNIVLTKSITIIGNNAVLDGQNKFEILTISGKDITIRGIQILL